MSPRLPGNPGVPSPCTGVCRIDPDTAQCRGCLRTIEEIRAWREMSDGQRLRLWRTVRERRNLLPGDTSA